MTRLTIAKAYERVNDTWPDIVPALTADEAVRAAKRLYRWALGEKFDGPVLVTTGNRYSDLRWTDGRLTLYVNAERGWKALVHNLSHDFYYRANRNELHKPHSKDHARVERNMIAQVLKRGWLDGRLKRAEKEKPEPTRDERAVQRLAKLDARIETWERKAKRAASSLKRLHVERRHIVRAIEKAQQTDEGAAA